MEKSSQITLTPGAVLLFKEGILPTGVQKTYGINTYEELKAVVDAGEYQVESGPLQTGLDLEVE
jgi:hypothetical protein